MPSAKTMLHAYQGQVAASRGAGMAGLGEQARLAPTIRALLDVVNDDHDPRALASAACAECATVAACCACRTHWIWDSWIADDGDRYHLFFLKAPSALGDPDLRHTSARIGHASSLDLVEWEVHADALGPYQRGFDDLALWTGSVARGDDGVWRLYYTAINTEGRDVRDQRIGMAESDDLHTWRRAVDQPLVTPGPALVPHARRRVRRERDVARPVRVPRRRTAGTC